MSTVTAAALHPGDTFTLPSGATHTAAQVNVLSHKVNIRTTVGEWVGLFPTVKVKTSPTTSAVHARYIGSAPSLA